MTTGRSPNYPSVSLAEAIERIKPLYQSIHTRPTEREIIAQHLGYKSLNGRSMTMIAALTSYGLFVKEGKGYLRVSDRTVSMIELDKGSQERAEAFKAAAFEPNIFGQIHADFGETLPKEGGFKHYLIKKGFLPTAADEIIRVYQDNRGLVNEEVEAYDAPMSTPSGQINVRHREGGVRATDTREAENLFESPANGRELRFNISRGTGAIVIFTGGDVTQEAIDKLSRMLELQKDTFPTQDDLQTLEDYAASKISLEPDTDS